MTTLHLCPLGFHPRLESVSELKHAVQGTLEGLRWLHRYDYVHQDLRWNNVIKDMEGNVRLIDLEYSGKEGVVPDEDILQHWPTMEGGRYSKNMDVYSVAKMIREYSSLLRRENGYSFVAKLERGISAEDTLKDNRFLE